MNLTMYFDSPGMQVGQAPHTKVSRTSLQLWTHSCGRKKWFYPRLGLPKFVTSRPACVQLCG